MPNDNRSVSAGRPALHAPDVRLATTVSRLRIEPAPARGRCRHGTDSSVLLDEAYLAPHLKERGRDKGFEELQMPSGAPAGGPLGRQRRQNLFDPADATLNVCRSLFQLLRRDRRRPLSSW